MDGLEKQCIDLIESIYKCKFIGRVQVTLVDDLYSLTIYEENPEFGGFTLAKQSESDQDFLDFVAKQLTENRLTRCKFQQLTIQPYEYLSECEQLQEGF